MLVGQRLSDPPPLLICQLSLSLSLSLVSFFAQDSRQFLSSKGEEELERGESPIPASESDHTHTHLFKCPPLFAFERRECPTSNGGAQKWKLGWNTQALRLCVSSARLGARLARSVGACQQKISASGAQEEVHRECAVGWVGALSSPIYIYIFSSGEAHDV